MKPSLLANFDHAILDGELLIYDRSEERGGMTVTNAAERIVDALRAQHVDTWPPRFVI